MQHREFSLVLHGDLQEWNGRSGREAHEGGEIHLLVADSY